MFSVLFQNFIVLPKQELINLNMQYDEFPINPGTKQGCP